MSAPRAHPPARVPIAPTEPAGRWQWAAYPGQEPQWFWFPDPPPPPRPPDPPVQPVRPVQTGWIPAASAPAPASEGPPTVWDDFRRRARRVGFLLLVLGFVCSGVLLYDQLGSGLGDQQLTLELDQDGAEPAGSDPSGTEASDPEASDPEASDPEASETDLAGADADPATTDAETDPGAANVDPAVLDELADTLRDRALASSAAMVAGDAAAALEYIEPGCRDRVAADLAASVEEARATYEGVSLDVASVRVTETEGKVAYRVEGTPTEAMNETEVPSAELPEPWVHVDGHWYRALPECAT